MTAPFALAPNNVVRRRPDGPLMTVSRIEGDVVWCDWVEGDRHRHEPVPAQELEFVGPKSEPD